MGQEEPQDHKVRRRFSIISNFELSNFDLTLSLNSGPPGTGLVGPKGERGGEYNLQRIIQQRYYIFFLILSFKLIEYGDIGPPGMISQDKME